MADENQEDAVSSFSADQPITAFSPLAPPTTSIVPPRPLPSSHHAGVGSDHVGSGQPSEQHSDGVHFGLSSVASEFGALGTGSSPGTSRRTSTRTSRRGRLGAGLVDVPSVPYRDPASAVLANPVVSENKRFCGHCGAKVGRGEHGIPGTAEGTCPHCDTEFSFVPRLRPKELVGGQYEVLGALAYGGLGWIYLAQDHNVSDRWVVLKGLIDTTDVTAMTSAVNEQRFLAEVEHPNIVKIYNFVQHPDHRSGTSVGYIVMEYIGGQSLRQLALARHREFGRGEPLPIGQVIAYGLEILPALGYLHGQGMLYCDLKPDNVIQTHEQLKLIDLGAVRRIDDYESPLFFTTGYSAPELTTQGASFASDLYTVGRTLAVLSFDFVDYTKKYRDSLPPKEEVPLFSLFDSYYRFLKRATHVDPDRRFISAEDMADQLTGVLREIMALGTGTQRPGVSTVFGPETKTFGVDMVVPETGRPVPLPDVNEVLLGLPVPQVNTDDVGAGVLAATLSVDPREAVNALANAPRESIEVRLRIVRARIGLGELAEANRQLQAAQYLAIKAGYPHDWRVDWYRGLIELAGGRERVAQVAFDAVYDDLPGESAPKLALAISAERVGDHFAAARLYELVWRTDHSSVSAAFGLARVYLAQGARASAIEVLEAVPASSTHHVAAQIAAVKIKIRESQHKGPTSAAAREDLLAAADKLQKLSLDTEQRVLLTIEVLQAAHRLVLAENPLAENPLPENRVSENRSSENRRPETPLSTQTPTGIPLPVSPSLARRKILGYEFTERELSFGLEHSYRVLARFADTMEERISLVDKANSVRPRTLT